MERLEYLTLVIVFLRCWGAKRISKFTGVEESIIKNILENLVSKRCVVRDGLFKYRVTSEGYKMLDYDIIKRMQEAFDARVTQKGFFVSVANILSAIMDFLVSGINSLANARMKPRFSINPSVEAAFDGRGVEDVIYCGGADGRRTLLSAITGAPPA
ncbi:hypothetical protein [Candidatus Alkanophaga liquidiphilum]|nr:MAG: hypothetical protein DRN91_04625 [Candidatus Alkanophagales archaeon]